MKRLYDNEMLRQHVIAHKLQDYLDTDLASISLLGTFEKGEDLISMGSISEYLYFLVDGTVMVYSYTSADQNICINYTHQSTMIGEASSLWETSPKSSVKAMSPCICVCIPLNRYRETLQNDVKLLRSICQILSYRLNSGIILANSINGPLESRLARFILEQATDDIFSFQLTTCADILNVSYRHLLRTITALRRDSILEKQRSYYLIIDRKALEVMANSDF